MRCSSILFRNKIAVLFPFPTTHTDYSFKFKINIIISVRSSYDYVRSFDQLPLVNSHLHPDFKFAEVSEAYVGSLLRQLN